MQIVIEIPEIIYDTIQSDEMISREQLAILQMHIMNGTLLPKGHGRLIDADAYREAWFNSRQFEPMLLLDFAPTIIEADKAESEDGE